MTEATPHDGPEPEPERLPILFQDDWLVAVDKPAGLLVHRTGLDAGETRFALQILRDQLGQLVWPLHRLDKGTSGILLFGLSAEIARKMGAAFESGVGMTKRYRAIVRGWPAESGEIDYPLRRLRDDRRADRTEVLPAQTRYRTLRELVVPIPYADFPSTRCAELELTPLTGRRHQLRRHLKHIAHPIIGDATHGKGPLNRAMADHTGITRLWLHAEHLSLLHPVTEAALLLHAPPPADWQVWN
jgi:tRNA pseudouridine65 synthase